MTNFYTLGLPRTRSVWLSNVLSQGNSIAFHEGLSIFGCQSLPARNKNHVGSCDTNPLNHVERAPLVIIERNKADVVESYLRAFDNPFDRPFRPFVESMIEKMSHELAKYQGLRINYNDLNKYNKIVEIIKFLQPSNEIDRYSIEKFMDTVIVTKNRCLKTSYSMTADYLYQTTIEGLYDKVLEEGAS